MKNIAVITDLSCVGNCSLSVAIPILSIMGHQCVPIPTATFSSQTGFVGYSYSVNDNINNTFDMANQLMSIDLFVVGFACSTAQLQEIGQLTREYKDICIVDPIMGDNGSLYNIYDNDYVSAMREVVKGSHVITPNLTEACLLTNKNYNEMIELASQKGGLAKLGAEFDNINSQLHTDSCVITGIPLGEYIANIVIQEDIRYVTTGYNGRSYSGTGDMFSSVVAGMLARGCDLHIAVEKASMFVYNCITATMADSDTRYGTKFQLVLDTLL